MIDAADFLDIPELHEAVCRHVAGLLEGMDAEGIKSFFKPEPAHTEAAGAVLAEGAAELEAPVAGD